jgi:hypothetical protein
VRWRKVCRTDFSVLAGAIGTGIRDSMEVWCTWHHQRESIDVAITHGA